MVLLDPALIGESFVHLGGNPASLARRRPSRCAEKTQLLVGSVQKPWWFMENSLLRIERLYILAIQNYLRWSRSESKKYWRIESISEVCDDPLSLSCKVVHSRSQVFSERL